MMLFDAGFAQDSLQTRSVFSHKERIDTMVIAGVHNGVAAVGETQVAVFRLCHRYGKPVPVGEGELSAEHQGAIRTSRETDSLREFIEQAVCRVKIESHETAAVRVPSVRARVRAREFGPAA